MSESSSGDNNKGCEIPCKIDSELSLDYDLRLNELGKIFSLNDDITNEILRQQLYSKEENYLKNVINGLMTEKLTSAVKKKTYIKTLNIDECLDTNQENLIIQAFPEFKLNFRRNRVNAHSVAAAFRKCETHLILNKLQYDNELEVGENNVLIKDVGGNFLFHINNSNYKIHTCAPILSKYDQSRFTSRMYDISNIINFRKDLNQYQRKILTDIHTVVDNNSLSTYSFCMKKSQNCSIKAKALMFIHSNYDMTLLEVADAMDNSNATIAYGTFIFIPKMLLEKSGYIESIGVDYEFLDPKQLYNIDSNNVYNHYDRIRFSFRNDSSYNYIHKTSIYFAYITINTFYSSKGNAYNLELQENRNGIQVFKITKHLVNIDFGDTLTHKIYFNIMDKTKVKFFDLDFENLYNYTNKVYPHEKKSFSKYLDDNCYASALKEISFFADKDIVEKTINFAIGVSESKFKPDELFNYIRSVCTRQIVANGVIRVNSNLSSLEMKALANAVYIYVYDLKYRYGKVTQQIISDINWNREYLDRGLLSKIFGPSRRNYLINNNNMFRVFHKILYNKWKVNISGDCFITKPKLCTDFENINSYIYRVYIKGKNIFCNDSPVINVRLEVPDVIDSDCMIDFKTLAKQIYRENFNIELNLLDTVNLENPVYEPVKQGIFSKMFNIFRKDNIYEKQLKCWEKKCEEYELKKHIIDVHNKIITIKDNCVKIKCLAQESRDLFKDNKLDMICYTQKFVELSFTKIFDKYFGNKFQKITDELFRNIEEFYIDYKIEDLLVRKFYDNQIMIRENFIDDTKKNFDYIFMYYTYDYSDSFYEKECEINYEKLFANVDEYLNIGGSLVMIVNIISDETLIENLSKLLCHFSSFDLYCPKIFDNIGNHIFLIAKNLSVGIHSEIDNIKIELLEKFLNFSFNFKNNSENINKKFLDENYKKIFLKKFNVEKTTDIISEDNLIENKINNIFDNNIVLKFLKLLDINKIDINNYLNISLYNMHKDIVKYFNFSNKYNIINRTLLNVNKILPKLKLEYLNEKIIVYWCNNNTVMIKDKDRNVNNNCNYDYSDYIFSFYKFSSNYYDIQEYKNYLKLLDKYIIDDLSYGGDLVFRVNLLLDTELIENLSKLLSCFDNFDIYYSISFETGIYVFIIAKQLLNKKFENILEVQKRFEEIYSNSVNNILRYYSNLMNFENLDIILNNLYDKLLEIDNSNKFQISVYKSLIEFNKINTINKDSKNLKFLLNVKSIQDIKIFSSDLSSDTLSTAYSDVCSDSNFDNNEEECNESDCEKDLVDYIESNGCIIKLCTVDINEFELRHSTVVDNNCLFNSMTEHRKIDLNQFRQYIMNITDDLEVKNECQFNSMAGTMTIETFVRHYNIGVVNIAEDLCQVILPQKNLNPMRYIYLNFKRNHYDLFKKICFGKKIYESKLYKNMFSPLLDTNQLENIRKIINCPLIEMNEFMCKNFNTNVIVNNLQFYCNEHIECANNNFEIIVNKLLRDKLEIVYIFIEEDNFDKDLFINIINKNKIMYRFIDLDFKGYLIVQIRKIMNKIEVNSFSINTDIIELRNHKCDKAKKFYNKNVTNCVVRYCCKPKTRFAQIEKEPSYYDKAIIIKKAEGIEKEERIGNTYIFEKNISVGCYNFDDRFFDIIKSFVSEDDIIYICSATVTLQELFKILKDIKVSSINYLYKVEYNDNNYYPKFITEQNELDYRLNCIYEILEIWRYTTKSVKNQLDTLIKEYNSTRGKPKDTSFGIIDIQNSKWILKPVVLSDVYNKAYYNNNFIDFTDYYNKGKFSNNIRKLGKGFLYVSKDTKLMLSDKLYERASKLKIDKKGVSKKLVIHNGAPGVGKTEFILNNHSVDLDKPINHIVLTNTRESAIDIRERAKAKFKLSENVLKEKYRTGDSYLLNHYGGSSEVLWIDEGFMKHPGEWFIYGIISNAKEIHIMGDIAQIPYQERTGKNVHFAKYDKRLLATVKNMGVSYRCPLDIIYWLNLSNKYNFKIQGKSKVFNSVNLNRISGVYDIVFNKYDHILTFTQEEKLSVLKQTDINYNNRVNTIHEYQGKQCNKVAIVRLINKANPVYDSKEHILVALSRHKVSLEYLTVVYNDSLSKEIGKIKNFSQAMLREVVYSGGGIIREDRIEPDKAIQIYTEPKYIRDIVMNHCYTGYVPYYFNVDYQFEYEYIEAEFMVTSSVNSINILQDFIDRVQPQSSVSYNKYDHQQLHENDMLILAENFYFSELYPYKFNSRDYLTSHLRTPIQRAIVPSIRQLVKAFAERNGSVPNLQGTINEFEQAKTLFEDFKKTFVAHGSVEMKQFPLTVNINSIKEWLNTQPVAVKNMLLNFDSDFLLGNNLQRYNYILKRVAKIDTEVDAHLRYKSPQTIAYLDKLVNTIFCPLWRDIKKRLMFILKDNTFIYVDESPLGFVEKLNHKFPVSYFRNNFNKFLEIDFSKYDKSQKLIALLYETMIMDYFGVDKELIDIWIFLHIYTELYNPKLKFNAFVNYQRKSGDAATFIGNTFFLMAVIASVFDLNSIPFYAMFSGDDSLLFVNQMPYSLQDKVDKLAYLYNLEAKLLSYATPYFCSKFLIPNIDNWIFVPDVIKLINKLGRNDLVDFQHVEEYRISFLDNLHYYKNALNYEIINIAVNDRYKIEGDHTIVYLALINISKDKNNFKKLYYLEDNCQLLIDPSRPSLDI